MSEPKCKMAHFCNVCGRFIASDEKCGNASDCFLEAYKQYLSQEFITDVNYAPKKVCFNCYSTLMQWESEKKKAMPFGIPMMWLDNSPHQQENCYGRINYHKNTFEEEEDEEEGQDKDELPEYLLDEIIDLSDDDDDDQDIRESSDVDPQPPAKRQMAKSLI